MAEVEKFTDGAIVTLMKHNERTLKNDSNKEIVKERTELNYSIPLDHGGLTDRKYYKKLIDDSYLYGRGTKSEDDAVTAFSWVITLPKEVSDYTVPEKGYVGYINEDAEKEFFNGALRFVSDRYGTENVFHNRIHYDEGGQPHIHIYVAPRKNLSHDQVHYSINRKTKRPIKTESGRWEYEYKYKLSTGDQKWVSDYEDYLKAGGEDKRIFVKNYAKMSDYYDKKLSCFEVINPMELKNFHSEFAAYLRKNDLPGANWVHTGVTGGKNISVKSMKEFTRNTGMTIDEAKALLRDREVMQGQVKDLERDVKTLTSSLATRDAYIETLKSQIHNMEISLNKSRDVSVNMEAAQTELLSKQKEVTQIKDTLSVKEAVLASVQKNYDNLQTRYQTLESSLTVSQAELLKAQDTIREMQRDQAVNASGTEAKDRQIEALQQQVASLKDQLRNVEEIKQHEIDAKDKEIERLKEEKSVTKEATREWGDTSGWGKVSGWGTVERSDKTWNMEQGNN